MPVKREFFAGWPVKKGPFAESSLEVPKDKNRAMNTRAKTIDDYLEALPDEKRALLEKLRKSIKAIAPAAEECISYGIPAFRLNGKVMVGFGAAANHCAFYPFSGSTIAAHRDDLAGYETSKGSIRFPADHPLPAALVRKLVKARIKEIGG